MSTRPDLRKLSSTALEAAQRYERHKLESPSEAVLQRLQLIPELFAGSSWVSDDFFYIFSILSLRPGAGHVTRLFRRILEIPFHLSVVSPSSPEMLRLVLRNGFQLEFAYDAAQHSNIEIWTLDCGVYAASHTSYLRPKTTESSDYLSAALTSLRRG